MSPDRNNVTAVALSAAAIAAAFTLLSWLVPLDRDSAEQFCQAEFGQGPDFGLCLSEYSEAMSQLDRQLGKRK